MQDVGHVTDSQFVIEQMKPGFFHEGFVDPTVGRPPVEMFQDSRKVTGINAQLAGIESNIVFFLAVLGQQVDKLHDDLFP